MRKMSESFNQTKHQAKDVGHKTQFRTSNALTNAWPNASSGPRLRLRMKRILLHRSFVFTSLCLLIAIFTQACAPNLSPQTSCNFVMSADSQRVSWGPAVPVVLYVDSSVPSEFYGAIEAAVMTWNQSLRREVLKIGGWTNSYPSERQDGVNVIYFNRKWPDEQRKKQAVTTVWWAADRVFEADVSVNGNSAHFDYFWGPTVVAGRVDFESLLVHELGHVLGLDHPKVPTKGTVMATELQVGVARRTPTPSDVEDLKCEY